MTVRLRVALGLAFCGMLGLAVAAAPLHANAAACKTDATDGCERDGLACSPPTGGKCVTVKTPVPLSAPKLSCACRVPTSRSLMLQTPNPCTSAAGREELLKSGGEKALAARCGPATTTTTHTPPTGYN